MPEPQLSGLAKRHATMQALHQTDLHMDPNEFTVHVGPSGCGKSTILRMIAGLETVSEGEIHVDGSPVSHLEPKDRDLEMVFQDYALHLHMSVANKSRTTCLLRLGSRGSPVPRQMPECARSPQCRA